MLIPDHFGADIDRGISMQDVETLLMHFDQENGDALLEVNYPETFFIPSITLNSENKIESYSYKIIFLIVLGRVDQHGGPGWTE